jgi:hypothetical protein
MTETSARFALPFLQPGQAQKEVYHNEALALLDIAVQAAVQSADVAVPPDSPATGSCWIVAAGATGAWAGRSGTIAGWTSGGWRFVEPSEGMQVWNVATALATACRGRVDRRADICEQRLDRRCPGRRTQGRGHRCARWWHGRRCRGQSRNHLNS